MTGQALWQTFVNQEDGEEENVPTEEVIQDSLVSSTQSLWQMLNANLMNLILGKE
jgi:hypothetical protein